jgi:hypothetical protein
MVIADDEADSPADGHLQHAIERRSRRTDMLHARDQEHNDRGHRQHVEIGAKRSDEGERRDCQRQHREQRPFAVVRNQDRDRAAIGDAREGADQIIFRHLDRAAQTHLGHDHRGQDRPERQMQVQDLRQREGRQRADRHPKRQDQLQPVAADPRAD